MTVHVEAIQDIHFHCAGPGCQKRMLLKGTPERVIDIARAHDWQTVREDFVGPLPLMVCSNACWQRYWLVSDDPQMKRAVEQILNPRVVRDQFGLATPDRGVPN